jgi:hypothetical protein
LENRSFLYACPEGKGHYFLSLVRYNPQTNSPVAKMPVSNQRKFLDSRNSSIRHAWGKTLFFIFREVQTPNKDAGQQDGGEYPEDIPRGQKVAHLSSLQPCRQRRFAPKYRPVALS